ncbi:hypothetical protein K457DRAFT_131462 [Linnemannia elongata AG-77]|uniref:Uncharacterized protein n=1 Tax=Linnemannia elongata AG-77 TaxID=1314771 RepID=A0A197JCG4_9FUNG|nr:hypothetical protein K457DRAFT_131462 [Linnemannia elongata AG-77]
MNLHVRTNSFDSLIFSFPRKVTNDFPIGRILMDTYDLTSCSTEQHLHHSSFEVTPADPLVYKAMVQGGLTINGTVYTPTIPAPPTFHALKVNFRRIPQHYKPDDIVKLLSSYGKPMHIGMYYRDHPKRKIWTQEGYVLFEVDDELSHPVLPREIKVGPGAPVILNTVGDPSPPFATTPSNNNKNINKAHPAKKFQQEDAEGFQPARRRKRNGKKRLKPNKTTGTHMEGVEPTSPAVPAVQIESITAQVVNPPPSRVNRLVGFVTGGLFQGPAAGNYRQTPTTDNNSDSDSENESALHHINKSPSHIPTAPLPVERPQRQRKEVDYNLAKTSRLSMQRSDQ